MEFVRNSNKKIIRSVISTSICDRIPLVLKFHDFSCFPWKFETSIEQFAYILRIIYGLHFSPCNGDSDTFRMHPPQLHYIFVRDTRTHVHRPYVRSTSGEVADNSAARTPSSRSLDNACHSLPRVTSADRSTLTVTRTGRCEDRKRSDASSSLGNDRSSKRSAEVVVDLRDT